MPTNKQDKDFADEMYQSIDVRMGTAALGNAVEWIAMNLAPDDVFSDKDLSAWAESNGYKKEE